MKEEKTLGIMLDCSRNAVMKPEKVKEFAKSDRDIKAPVLVSNDPEYRMLDTENEELVRVICDTADGEILLTDYQSCGKNWLQEKNLITVWLD